MNHIHTTIDIDAPAATVWAVLTEFESYPEWNPRSRITGVAAAGERLVVAPGPEAEGMPTFRPRVLAAGSVEYAEGDSEAGEASQAGETTDTSEGDAGSETSEAFELRWLGHLWLRGLFDGEHSFRVESLGPNRSRLIQSETFSGLLTGLLLRRYGADTEAGFQAVNEALKARAEGMVATERPSSAGTAAAN